MAGHKFDAQDFASAYIQTLEYKKSAEDFESTKEYLDTRRKVYLDEYLKAYVDAIEFAEEILNRNNESE